MKVLLINGSPKQEGNTSTALHVVGGSLEKNGIETVYLHVGHEVVRGCTACGGCRNTPGRLCIYDDAVNKAIEIMAGCDGLVVGSPVYYSGIAGTMKSFLDRFFYSGGGQYCRYKPVAAVCALRRSGGVDTFHQLNNYFNLASALIVPNFYWGAVHGGSPGEMIRDDEGVQIMQNIGQNMAWMIKTLDYAKDACPPPEGMKRVSTNFIR